MASDCPQQGDLRLSEYALCLDLIVLDLHRLVARGFEACPPARGEPDAGEGALAEAGAVGRIEESEIVGAAGEVLGGLGADVGLSPEFLDVGAQGFERGALRPQMISSRASAG